MSEESIDAQLNNNEDMSKKQKELLSLMESYDDDVSYEPKSGEKVQGTIIAIKNEYAFVDIGTKNEAIINISELRDKEGNITHGIDDTIEAYVVSSHNGEIVLSTSLGGYRADMSQLLEAQKNAIPIQGKVSGVNKGGLNVNILGRKAFCPVSKIDITRVEDSNEYLGFTGLFVITDVDDKGRNIVVSRLPILQEKVSQRLQQLKKDAEEKNVVAGTITKITKFGVFVDLGGIEGLVHISEVSWDKTDRLHEQFEPGQQIHCVVLSVDEKENMRDSRIALSLKQVDGDPWDNISSRFSSGTKVSGTVTRLANFGAFVRIAPGIEGLIHVSEMSWSTRIRHPKDVLSVGDDVEATILSVDEQRRQIKLSLKDKDSDPWAAVEARFAPGTVAEGFVEKEMPYGFFVRLEEGITGLLPKSNIAKEDAAGIKSGEKTTVTVQSVDTENRRISLQSGSRTEAIDNEQAVQAHTKNQNKPPKRKDSSSTEFGDALKNALSGENGEDAHK